MMQFLYLFAVTNNKKSKTNCNLNNVFVEESSYDGLIYDSFIGNNWTKSSNKFIYNKILGVGKEASFTVNFKTIKSGNFTNVVVVGSNETPNSTTNNTTQSVSPKLSVIKISNTNISFALGLVNLDSKIKFIRSQ